MPESKSSRIRAVLVSLLILILAQALALIVVSKEHPYLDSKNIALPPSPPDTVVFWPQNVTSPSGDVVQVQGYSSFGPILIYFLAAVIVIGGSLFFVPVSKLTLVLRAVFTMLFAWGTFIIFLFFVPFWVTITAAAAMGIGWFFVRRIWMHNLAMLFAMASLGVVFGNLISPWTTMLFLLAIAVYDFLAVRFGYMIWMTEKLSESDNLPAFIIPFKLRDWGASLSRTLVKDIVETQPSERTESVLGGGDIGFAVLIVCSVYFSTSLGGALLMCMFTLLGLASAYLIQSLFLKGKPMPALPPIAVFAALGLILISGFPKF
jgi:presenilin-like A22 family membrane protease